MGAIVLEEIFSSRGRVKVLKVLAKVGEINISELVRRSGLNYMSVQNHLKSLKSLDVIEEKRFGRIRIISLKRNRVGVFIERLFREWDRMGGPEPFTALSS